METNEKDKIKKAMFLLAFASAFVGIYYGFSDSILANYFREAYGVGAAQRGLIELPRELPGIVSLFVISALSFLRDIRIAIVAQVFGAIGMMALGLWHPTFGVMLVFLFIYSLGLHMYIPLGDSIPLSFAKQGNMGRTLGRLNSVRMAAMMLVGIATFLGFRYGVFTFEAPVAVFIICAVCFIAIAVILFILYKTVGDPSQSAEKPRLVWHKAYMRYYVICALYGGRKQIMIVFSPWVLIELLDFRADTMSILGVIGAFIGIFFIPAVGHMIDRLGTKKVMIFEAACFIVVYAAYGFLTNWITGNVVVLTGIAMLFIYALFIVDRMSVQFSIVRSIYMKSIALTPEDVTPSLSTGMAIDHVVAIVGSFVCGIIWERFGPEYVFIIASVLSLSNMLVAAGIKRQIADGKGDASHG
jgi:predicted MFS family arabinose efflux permease